MDIFFRLDHIVLNFIYRQCSKLGSLGTIGLGAGIFAGFKNVGINTLVAY